MVVKASFHHFLFLLFFWSLEAKFIIWFVTAAFKRLSRLEGIIPALETSHALAYLEKLCPTLPDGTKVVLNCSGRGDKDVQTAIKYLQVWYITMATSTSKTRGHFLLVKASSKLNCFPIWWDPSLKTIKHTLQSKVSFPCLSFLLETICCIYTSKVCILIQILAKWIVWRGLVGIDFTVYASFWGFNEWVCIKCLDLLHKKKLDKQCNLCLDWYVLYRKWEWDLQTYFHVDKQYIKECLTYIA